MAHEAPWWRSFFSGPVVDFWLGATTAEQTKLEAEFVRESLGVEPPAKLLDVPCGGGRHCLALAAQGFEMTGVDLSAGFLAAAREADPAGSIAWEGREMRDLPWSGRFDGAFCLGNSFAYDTDEGNADFLRAVARALKPGAGFVVETSYVAECLLPSLQERAWYEVGDTLVLAQRRYDHAGGRLHVEYVFVVGGSVERRSMSARLYSYREVLGLLEGAGFSGLTAYGSFGREPFKLGSARMLAAGRRV